MKSVMLADNDAIEFTDKRIRYPMLGSIKYDGNRFILINGSWLTRTMKEQPNRNLPLRFKALTELSREKKLVIDGELWGDEFTALQSVFRAYHAEIPEKLKAYVFDMLTLDEWQGTPGLKFVDRFWRYGETFSLSSWYDEHGVVPVIQHPISSAEQAENYYQVFLNEGHEGMMLKDPNGFYHHGRTSLHQGLMFKFKKFMTEDATIIEFIPKKTLKEGIERTRDVFGHLERPHTQDSFEEVDDVGAVRVKMKDGRVVKLGFAKGWDHGQRKVLWQMREGLIGKWCEFRYMQHGTKDLPRFPALVRLRPDLD